jgi:nucleotide sugar dehydrogenase
MASSRIAIIGCGVLGRAYLSAFQSKGHRTFGIDINRNALTECREMLHVPMYHPDDIDDIDDVHDMQFIMVCVNTPTSQDGSSGLDMSRVFATVPIVHRLLVDSPTAVVLLRSTVTPGTTHLYKKALEVEALKAPSAQGTKRSRHQALGSNVVFQPEFLRAKSSYEDAKSPWCIAIGRDTDLPNELAHALETLYASFVTPDRIHWLSVGEAEVLKMVSNTFNACKISFFNAWFIMCRQIDPSIDFSHITSAMVHCNEGLLNAKYGTKPHAFYGACLPKDAGACARLEEQMGITSGMFGAIVAVNQDIKALIPDVVLDGDFHMQDMC